MLIRIVFRISLWEISEKQKKWSFPTHSPQLNSVVETLLETDHTKIQKMGSEEVVHYWYDSETYRIHLWFENTSDLDYLIWSLSEGGPDVWMESPNIRLSSHVFDLNEYLEGFPLDVTDIEIIPKIEKIYSEYDITHEYLL